MMHVLQGLVQMEILRKIEMVAEAPIGDLFDWIVGTSTGGIVALGTVYGKDRHYAAPAVTAANKVGGV